MCVEVKKLQEAHDSWESFEEALLEKYEYEEQKGGGFCKFNVWLVSTKTHQSATDMFLEFEHRFAQLSRQHQTLVGVD